MTFIHFKNNSSRSEYFHQGIVGILDSKNSIIVSEYLSSFYPCLLFQNLFAKVEI